MTFSRNWPDLLLSLLSRKDLSISQATWAMEQVLAGEVTDSQLAAFLVALRAKGETVQEIVGFRDAILEAAEPLPLDSMALDIVGTGGDRHGTVNISSTAAIIAAAAGVPVIKHGNRAASSSSGSSDVLKELGVNLELSPASLAEVYEKTRLVFVFATAFHPGFRHAGKVRKELAIPTVFNFLGPLSNPARPEASAVGVADYDKAPLIAGVFQTRGAAALVFRGDDGLDEMTTTGHSHIWEVSRGIIKEHDFNPADLGIPRAKLEDLIGGEPAQNAEVLRRTLDGERGPVRDIVLLNAAAGLTAYALAEDPAQIDRSIIERLAEKYELAARAIDSGAAAVKLKEWVQATQSFQS